MLLVAFFSTWQMLTQAKGACSYCSYLYWVDVGPPARIERAKQDGTEREVVIHDRIDTPSGLSIDYDAQALYWSDRTFDTIERVDLRPNHNMTRKVIVRNVADCMGVTVFGQYIYWTDE